ncbi:MAG TPA: hypothetical protein VEB23_11555 [Ramlibacter sp.]|nr:hypothetical protein [Ramlibacter sp.]
MSEAALPDISGDWFAAMRRGDWEAAWRATDRIELPRREAARRQPGFQRSPAHLHWDGTPTAGRCVLVRCEHGLGDTLMFMRFVPLLGARELHFMVQPPLLELLRGAPGLGDVRNWWDCGPLPDHDVDVEVMELPYVLRMSLPQLPPPYPHLASQLPAADELDLPEDGLLRVGLLWSVSDWDQSRSVPLAALRPLLEIDGVRFYSLQQGRAAHDPLLQELGVEVLSPRTATLPMAAAAMHRMDLVITPDGMATHLAGTLARPTWMLLLHDADWRWMEARTDSPWYPSVRLFRQPRSGDWEAPVQQAAEALRALVRAHAPVSAAAPAR